MFTREVHMLVDVRCNIHDEPLLVYNTKRKLVDGKWLTVIVTGICRIDAGCNQENYTPLRIIDKSVIDEYNTQEYAIEPISSEVTTLELLRKLYIAFIRHRTQTHTVKLKVCETCAESDEIMYDVLKALSH